MQTNDQELRSDTPLELSIIFVNWNSLNYLRECIPSIYEFTRGIPFEIIVVDNASPAEDADVLKQEFPNIRLIKSAENLGFAGANNLGFTHSSGKHILFLNPDTKLLSPAINIMLEHLQSLPDVGIVGGKLLNSDLSVQTSSIMKFPTILNEVFQSEHLRLRWPKFSGIGPLFANSTEPAKVEAVSGACMLIKRENFEKAGMFSEDYFMYAEDLDLCYKVVRAGFSNYYVGQAKIVHHAGKSSAPEWQTVMKLRSQLRFCAKNYGHPYALMFRFALTLNAMARIGVIAILSPFRKILGVKKDLDSASAKWSTILKTLLTQSNPGRELPSGRKNVSDCRVLKT